MIEVVIYIYLTVLIIFGTVGIIALLVSLGLAAFGDVDKEAFMFSGILIGVALFWPVILPAIMVVGAVKAVKNW